MVHQLVHRIVVSFCGIVAVAAAASGQVVAPSIFSDRSPAGIYAASCASCHGANHQGGNAGSLADGVFRYGSDDRSVRRNIAAGITTMGMPAYGQVLSEDEINTLTAWIRQQELAVRVAPPQLPPVMKTELHSFRIEVVATDLDQPWAVDWLPDGTGLITEKTGDVRVLKDGKLLPDAVEGIPESRAHGQGGLMDVAIDPDYANGENWVYLSYTQELPDQDGRFQTRIVRGKIVDNAWTDEQVLFEAKPEHYTGAGVHFGSRIVFGNDGKLFFSIGERGEMMGAQDVTRPAGKHYRINRDGSIPADNPFVDRKDAYRAIYCYGNRNPQGLAIQRSTGLLWSTEHGPMGGDELNIIEPGKNYGWPVITYGINYDGKPITDITEKQGMEQPVVYWKPSIATCGLDFYTGDRFPKWEGDLIVGSLASTQLRRLRLDGKKVASQETILKDRGRIRDVNCGPDGYLYLVINGPDQLIRLIPAE